MGRILRSTLTGLYSIFLFLPGAFIVIGIVIAFKAIKTGSFTQFKQEMKKLVLPAND